MPSLPWKRKAMLRTAWGSQSRRTLTGWTWEGRRLEDWPHIRYSANFPCSLKLAVIHWSFPKQGCLPFLNPHQHMLTHSLAKGYTLQPHACLGYDLCPKQADPWSRLSPKLWPHPGVSQIFSRISARNPEESVACWCSARHTPALTPAPAPSPWHGSEDSPGQQEMSSLKRSHGGEFTNVSVTVDKTGCAFNRQETIRRASLFTLHILLNLQ